MKQYEFEVKFEDETGSIRRFIVIAYCALEVASYLSYTLSIEDEVISIIRMGESNETECN